MLRSALLLLAVACGPPLEWHEETEPMTLVFNSALPRRPDNLGPIEREGAPPACLLEFKGTREVPVKTRDEYSCLRPLGAVADVTLLLAEGREPAPINVQWR